MPPFKPEALLSPPSSEDYRKPCIRYARKRYSTLKQLKGWKVRVGSVRAVDDAIRHVSILTRIWQSLIVNTQSAPYAWVVSSKRMPLPFASGDSMDGGYTSEEMDCFERDGAGWHAGERSIFRCRCQGYYRSFFLASPTSTVA